MNIIERTVKFFHDFCVPRYEDGEKQYGNRLDGLTIAEAVDELAAELADAMMYLTRVRELANEAPIKPRPIGIRIFIGTNRTKPPYAVRGFIVLGDDEPILRHGYWIYRSEGEKGQFLGFYKGEDNLPEPGTGMWLE